MVLLIKKDFFPGEVCPLYFSEKYILSKSKHIHRKVKCAHLVPDVDEEVVGPDQIFISSVVVAVKLLKLTVNVKSSGTAAEAGMMTILFAERAVRTPPT